MPWWWRPMAQVRIGQPLLSAPRVQVHRYPAWAKALFLQQNALLASVLWTRGQSMNKPLWRSGRVLELWTGRWLSQGWPRENGFRAGPPRPHVKPPLKKLIQVSVHAKLNEFPASPRTTPSSCLAVWLFPDWSPGRHRSLNTHSSTRSCSAVWGRRIPKCAVRSNTFLVLKTSRSKFVEPQKWRSRWMASLPHMRYTSAKT